MQILQYNRQKLYYKWALILCIIALTGYTFYFEFEDYSKGLTIFTDNVSLYIRLALVVYFLLLLFYINRIPDYIFNLLGFVIAVPLGWSVSVICYLTVGWEGITVTGFIFLILASAVVFDFSLRNFAISLFLILSFHFTILSFYPKPQTEYMLSHIFLLSLSSILGLTINYLVNIIKKNETQALQERALLLKEIHHRVKNNLQVVSSLLDLQSGTIPDEKTKTMIKESQSRVKSMALIHQLLYETDTFTTIDFSIYLRQLMDSLSSAFAKPGKNIEYSLNTDKILLNIDTAVALGLITNELATNAYKYAFPNKSKGNIDIRFKNAPDHTISLTIQDNGTGFPESFNFENTQTLGLKLVKLLARQIKADLKYTVNHGTEFKIIIPGEL